MLSSVEFDAEMMERALALARRAMGQTSPNPMVGAVVVRNRRIIGEGYHHRAGAPHAEIHALNAAGDRAKGSDLYVTLEPCSTHGRTPPCTDAIINAGIRRVVVAAVDPNPKHSGQGLELLKKAEIRVEVGLLCEEASKLNEPFNKWIRTGMPFLTVKAAMSLDGKIATRIGESKWITGEKSRAFVQELRRGADAVMVGSGTIIADNPQLIVRDGAIDRQPRRVVVDSRGRSALDARVFSDEHHQRTIVLTSERSPEPWRKQLGDRGVTVLTCALRDDHLDVSDALKSLTEHEVISVLVEGGGGLIGALFDARLVDKAVFFYAPKIIGGTDAPTAVEGKGIEQLKNAVALRKVEWRHLGDDLVVIGYC
ncbi:MAG: bifunctional diaminohydroxyphosphoribosylaminopyrimidine deaminase/5-amino-6-(5-phosphoribosylamino)uracil reductase RibD [Verrucomicrobia bacterium]|nr:bifunctional diaminohydroxyphosphoribosylaminopyrimidine deaminase/5-amino-6-(5-phosphoribosylamino)uracil reductase RibD [Verrucomicrobiota bacterium]